MTIFIKENRTRKEETNYYDHSCKLYDCYILTLCFQQRTLYKGKVCIYYYYSLLSLEDLTFLFGDTSFRVIKALAKQ